MDQCNICGAPVFKESNHIRIKSKGLRPQWICTDCSERYTECAMVGRYLQYTAPKTYYTALVQAEKICSDE